MLIIQGEFRGLYKVGSGCVISATRPLYGRCTSIKGGSSNRFSSS